MNLEFQMLDPELPAPRKALDGDAGLDLFARNSALLEPRGGRVTIPTGISIAVEPGYVGLVVARSGLAANHGVTVLNAPGIIDSGYRGELFVVLINLDPRASFSVKRGDRIAQLVFTVVASFTLSRVAFLSPTMRGHGGLGHTGR